METHDKNSSRFNPTSSRSKEEMLVDWIQGVGTMLVTLVIGALTIQQAWTAEQNRQQDMKIARSAEHNKILSAYIQQMMQEPFAAQLKANQVPDAARLEAKLLTVHAANQLDGEYRAKLLKFLYKQNLIGGQCKVNPLTALPSDCKPEIVELKDINLENAALEDAAKSSSAQNFLSLKGANLSGVSLVGAELPNTNLSGSTIKEVDMERAQLPGALLSDAHMEGVVLQNANLANAKLSRAHLDGANLQSADLYKANLQGACLTKASLTRTILRKSKLQGANLTGVGDLAEANLKGAEFDSKTVFPDGFSKEDAKREGMREVTLTSPSSQCVEKKSSNT